MYEKVDTLRQSLPEKALDQAEGKIWGPGQNFHVRFIEVSFCLCFVMKLKNSGYATIHVAPSRLLTNLGAEAEKLRRAQTILLNEAAVIGVEDCFVLMNNSYAYLMQDIDDEELTPRAILHDTVAEFKIPIDITNTYVYRYNLPKVGNGLSAENMDVEVTNQSVSIQVSRTKYEFESFGLEEGFGKVIGYD